MGNKENARLYTAKEKVIAALFYGGVSIVLILAIKTCLTTYKFPDALFLAFAQSCCTIIGLYAGYATGQLELSFSWETFSKVKLLSFVNAINVGSGLVGTKAVNIPMFAALRRASIPLSMAGEAYILQQHPSTKVQLSVLLMVGGAVVAAMNDLAFDLFGYFAILTSAFCTALSNVLTKSVMTNLPKVGKWNMLLYNNIIAIPVYILLLCYRGTLPQVYAFADWGNYGFLSTFIASSILGIILQFSILYAIQVNGALSLTVTGLLKNILSTYIGMLGLGGDYIFTWLNFVGVNVSMVGGLYYAVVRHAESNVKTKTEENIDTTHSENGSIAKKLQV
jgi:solute carrier family 35 protein|eukprot:Stramenopile-MAST_4_protein_3984